MNYYETDPEFMERFEQFAYNEVVNEPGQQLDDQTRYLAVLAALTGCQGLEEFEETLAFLKRIRLFETHVFKYSRRRGTRAAVMENQIPEQVKTERSRILMELDRENSEAYILEQRGRDVEILIEEKMVLNGTEYQVGHTKEYIRAAVIAEQDLTNRIVSARIENMLEERLCLASLR